MRPNGGNYETQYRNDVATIWGILRPRADFRTPLTGKSSLDAVERRHGVGSFPDWCRNALD